MMYSCTHFSRIARSRYETFIFRSPQGYSVQSCLDCPDFLSFPGYIENWAGLSSGTIREVIENTEGMQTGFAEIYDKSKGPITSETAEFLVNEYQRLSQAVADGTYSRKPQDGTYSGYIYGDYFLIGSYFIRRCHTACSILRTWQNVWSKKRII